MAVSGPLTLLTVLLTMAQCPLSCPATGQLTGSRWTGQTGQGVSTSQLTVASRSKLDCIKECGRYPYCHTAAFQRSTATCHLLPVITDVTPGHDVIVYQDNDPLCSVDDAPSLGNATMTWTRTLTSLTGDVTCAEHHVWSGGDNLVSCALDNSWTVGGQCLQKYWTTPEIRENYYIPLSVGVGWKMCATGTPFANASAIAVNLFTSDGDRPMKVVFAFVENGIPTYNTRVLANMGGSFINSQTVTSPAFPMAESSPFLLEIIAATSSSVDAYVNGDFYFSYKLIVDVSTIVRVKFMEDAVLHDLDLWC